MRRWRRDQVWMDLIGKTFDSILKLNNFPKDVHKNCMAAFSSCFVPHLGPTPVEFRSNSYFQPCSTMVDDHTPVEFSTVVASNGKTTIRFYLEPLSPISGLPALQSTWLVSLNELGAALNVEHRDFTWFSICEQTLTIDMTTNAHHKPRSNPLGFTQFYYGKRVSHRQKIVITSTHLSCFRWRGRRTRQHCTEGLLLSRSAI